MVGQTSVLCTLRCERVRQTKALWCFFAFDLLFENGINLTRLPLSERKRDLHRLCSKSRVPCLKKVESFPNGDVLFEHCKQMELEGIVSKRKDRPYVSGPSRSWLNIKCEAWRRQNEHRSKMFERPKKPTTPTEREKTLQRKRGRAFPRA
jgi:ATP-dependent DNA ligase